MSHKYKKMQNNPIINTIDHQEINLDLLYLLEIENDIDYFCQSCQEILSSYINFNSLIVSQIIDDQWEKIEVIYHNQTKTDVEEYLSNIYRTTQSQNQSLDKSIYLNFEEEKYCPNIYYYNLFKAENINYLYIIPLQFKNNLLGHLLIEIKQFEYNKFQADHIINLVSKYLAIYLYQNILESKEIELKEQEINLKKSKENQNTYLSHMNHELRTPIAAVIGFAKMLQQQLYGQLNPKQAQYVDAIHQSGQYLLDLISDLLDISKIEAKKEDLYIEKILVTELCESCLALIKTRAENQGLELKLNVPSNIEYCYIDHRRIKQVLLNLLSNAVKFTEVGSITLDIKQENNYLKFNVIDTGIGINQESQQKLFQPFSQLNTHLHRQNRGTGLGLVISRELARLHGGDIILTSEENKGSCFTLSIPLKN